MGRARGMNSKIVAIVGLLVLLPGLASAADKPLALRVELDRPAPIYAPGEAVAVTISTARDATVDIWMIDEAGRQTPVVRSASVRADAPTRFAVVDRKHGGALGLNEIQVIARGVSSAPQPETRSLTDASSRLAGRANREEVRVVFQVVRRSGQR